ncbi:MAG: beta-N-acetylhexosaminidase family protein, partial [Gammaproteobacteria bacterium]|nr:beta-N-acetylhexosaminidase family protein [Gammaproteobacteria bacterium]
MLDMRLPTNTPQNARQNDRPALLPWPERIEVSSGKRRCNGAVAVEFTAAESARLNRAAARFETSVQRTCTAGNGGSDPLRLRIMCASECAEHPQLGDEEGYRLVVSDEGVSLSAPSEWGVLHGL